MGTSLGSCARSDRGSPPRQPPRLGSARDALRLEHPACAGPLLLALLAAEAFGATAGGVAGGFVSLAFFGFALSLPRVVAVLFERARRALDWLASLTGRVPRWTGVLLIALGLWSAWFGLFVTLKNNP